MVSCVHCLASGLMVPMLEMHLEMYYNVNKISYTIVFDTNHQYLISKGLHLLVNPYYHVVHLAKKVWDSLMPLITYQM